MEKTRNTVPELSDQERDKILHDLFLGKEGELDSSFLYKGKGAELYEKISKDINYPFIDIEISGLKKLQNNQNFKKILDKTDFITDVGCGDGQKVFALLKGLSRKGTCILEDYSRKMIEIAENFIKNHLPELILGSSQKLNNDKHLSQQLSNNMYLFLGGTICNMTDEEIVTELKNMDNNGFINGNHILLSYFTAPNTEDEIHKLEKIYKSDSNKAFHENGIEMLGLSKDNFEYDAVYEKDNPEQKDGPFPGKIKGIIRAKKDTSVVLSNGEKIEVKQGKEFTIHYSRRFTKPQISELFKKSGCKSVLSMDKDGDSIVLLKRKPTRTKKFIDKYKKGLMIALSIGSMFVGAAVNNVLNTRAQNEKDKQESLLDWYGTRLSNKNISSYETTYYKQETDELINALQLNDLNEEDRKIIINLFNIYVGEHKTDGMSNITLIRNFWTLYGKLLINDYNVKHYPYDFMNNIIIHNTNMFNGDLSCDLIKVPPHNKPTYKVMNLGNFNSFIKVHSGGRRVLEYQDGGKSYLILTVEINTKDGKKEIYMVTDENGEAFKYPEYSTGNLDKIKDKSGLDSNIVSNTKSLRGNFIFQGNVDRMGIEHNPSIESKIINKDADKIIKLGELNDTNINKIYGLFINGKFYHIILVHTRSGEEIGLASESLGGKFSVFEFKKIAEQFGEEYNEGHTIGNIPY